MAFAKRRSGARKEVGAPREWLVKGGQLHSVKPWRLEDVLGKPLGRRG
jgi:hypothetical protein